MNKKIKYCFYITEFFVGMSVIAMLQNACRLFWPYDGRRELSHICNNREIIVENLFPIIFLGIAAIIVVSMLLGSLFGMKCLNKKLKLNGTYISMIIAAAWMSLAPIAGEYMILHTLMYDINTYYLDFGIIQCLVLFAVPAFLFGSVNTSLVKYSVIQFNDGGKTVAALSIWNKIGAFIGVVLFAFVVSSEVISATVVSYLSIIILVVSIVCFIVCKIEQARKA